MTDRELMQQALEALDNSVDQMRYAYETDWRHGMPTRKAQLDRMKQELDAHEAAITALRERLAQPDTKVNSAETAKQISEPVVRWVCKGCGHEYMEAPSSCDCMENREYERVEYFTFPPQRKPLTDEEISRIWMLNGGGLAANRYHDFARAIEAAHGIKGDAS